MDSLTLWRVTGETSTDSSGGEETWLYLTDGSVPDTRKPIQSDGHHRKRVWYRIDKIERIGTMPPVLHSDSQLAKTIQEWL